MDLSLSFVGIAVVCVIVTAFVAWVYFTAQRLNGLHIRTDSALGQLQAALDRRAAVVAALVPSLSELSSTAESHQLHHGDFSARSDAERALSAALRAQFPEGVEPPSALIDAEVRVQLAHRFYNEAVSDTRALRLRPIVRLLRLGGTAALPDFFDYVGVH